MKKIFGLILLMGSTAFAGGEVVLDEMHDSTASMSQMTQSMANATKAMAATTESLGELTKNIAASEVKALSCIYTFKRNSRVPSKRTDTTELVPTVTQELDLPEAANLRARISREVALDGHQLTLNAMVSRQGHLSIFLSSDERGRAASAGTHPYVKDQEVSAQLNFSADPEVTTLVFVNCVVK